MNQKLKFLILTFSIVSILNVFSQPNPYTINVGNTQVTALSDGSITLDTDLLFNDKLIKPSDVLFRKFQINPIELSVNVYLIRTKDSNILVDTGSGELMGDFGGKLLDQLNEVNLRADDITHILISHIHADHTGGLIVQDKKIFINAKIYIHKNELDFWFDDQNIQNADINHPGANPKTFENAKKKLKPYLDSNQVITFEKNIEIISGIHTIHYPGHSPGHTVFVLTSQNENIYFFGDLAHIQNYQFEYPTAEILFDVDRKLGINSRLDFYKIATSQNYLIAGSHISFPGFGYIQYKDNKYHWLPIIYSEYGRYR